MVIYGSRFSCLCVYLPLLYWFLAVLCLLFALLCVFSKDVMVAFSCNILFSSLFHHLVDVHGTCWEVGVNGAAGVKVVGVAICSHHKF